MINRILAASLFVILAAGCAKEEDTVTAPPVDHLQGQWLSNCVRGQHRAITTPVEFGITQVSEVQIVDDEIIEVTRVTSNLCDGNDVEITTEGTFERLPGTEAEVTEIDISIDSYYMKPVTEFGMRVLNLRKWCGLTDWEVGKEVELTGKAGTRDCFPPTKLNTVYSIDHAEGRLFFATREKSGEVTERATKIRQDTYFERIQAPLRERREK